MIGNNELMLNEATLVEALQEYLNKRMQSYAPTVVAVSQEVSSSQSRTFSVRVSERSPLEPKP